MSFLMCTKRNLAILLALAFGMMAVPCLLADIAGSTTVPADLGKNVAASANGGSITDVSSEFSSSYLAEKAIDGNTNGRINAQYYQRGLLPVGSFSQTKFEIEPYYDLDFGEQRVIEYFDIWNTVELNGSDIETVSEHFKEFSVFISDTPFTGTTFAESQAEADFEYMHNFYKGVKGKVAEYS